MKSDRLYPFLVVLLILLLIGSAVLAAWMYRLLAQPGDDGMFGSAPSVEQTERPGLWRGWRSGDAPRGSPGPDGTHDKWARNPPAIPAPAGSPNLTGADEREDRGRTDGLFYGMPVVMPELCEDYGGEYSLLAPGATIMPFLSPGVLCLDVQRPEVFVPESEPLRYTVGETEHDACELDRTVKLCVDIGKIVPEMGRRTWDPLYGPSPMQSREPEDLLETWHSPFAGAPTPEDADAPRGGAPAAPPDPAIALGGRQHHYLNNNPQRWFSDLPPAATATLNDFQPGVDVSIHADQNRLEYVFVFWPETDPLDVEFAYHEALGVRELGPDNIGIDYECATLIQHRPFAYEWHDDRPYERPVHYRIIGKTVRLEFAYRHEQPRALAAATATAGHAPDYPPVTDYRSFLGGGGRDRAYAVAVDNQGYAYVAGSTTSATFGPADDNRLDADAHTDAFVSKIRIHDRQVIYTTFIGGRHNDHAYALVAASDGSVYVCGETLSPDFATVTAPPGGVIGRGWDAFVVKLDPAGRMSDLACRIGGRGDDRAYGIALDADHNLYLTGVTHSDDFPLTADAAQSTPGGGADAYLMKLSPKGELLYATRLGGSGDDHAYALAIGPDNAPVIVGQTTSTDFPTAYAMQPNPGGNRDGFVAKFSTDGSLAFATYLGGANDDRALGVTVDLANHIWIAGETASANFPTAHPVQAAFAGGNWDAFLCRLPPEGTPLLRSTYLGGSGDDRAYGVAVEASGRAHLAGHTTSTNLPMIRPIQDTFGGGPADGFIAGLAEDALSMRYLTYVGGSSNDAVHALAVEAGRILHLAGVTASADLTLVDPLQSAHRGEDDALVARLLAEYPRTPPLRLVPAGGMPDGPFYDYYLGKYEITNEEFAFFLNDAQANPDSARGTNMHFDVLGNVWMNPEMVRERDELFGIRASRLLYQPSFPIGSRYHVTPATSREGGTYGRHPIAGVSWFGAVKYCNWLTVETGRGESQRCYREGTRPLDWAPITCPPGDWERGAFTSPQRFAWLSYRGFRLPMDNSAHAPETGLVFLVTHDEFAAFLNDAEANSNALRSAHMHFDAAGNVALNPQHEREHRLFSIDGTWLEYNPEQAAGVRYQVLPTPDGFPPPPFTERTISNVTWYGAMKYCNWLTLMDGLAPEERGYREGPQPEDWAPSTASREGWNRGEFTEAERRFWMHLKGYRLPLISHTARATGQVPVLGRYTPPTNSWPNAFNEVLKVASWVIGTNTSFGFGRDGFDYQDANYLDSGMFAKHNTTPVGFYDGSAHEGRSLTRTNENLFGIYDLTGNVSEWTTDPGIVGSSLDRAYYGGSWRFPIAKTTDRAYVHPYFTENFMGFRVATVSASDHMCVLRIPFRLCICGYGVGPGCGREEGEDGKGVSDTTADRREAADLGDLDSHQGIITRDEDIDRGPDDGPDDEGGGGRPSRPTEPEEPPIESPSDDGG